MVLWVSFFVFWLGFLILLLFPNLGLVFIIYQVSVSNLMQFYSIT